VTAELASSIKDITSAAAATGDTPRTFYELGDDPELYGPAPDSFIADLVTLAGGDAITTSDPAVFSIPVEQLIVADPEVIVLGDAAYGVCPSTVAARPGWAGITAVKDGAVRPVNDTIITRPGPRLADGLASLTRAIHPELADELADVIQVGHSGILALVSDPGVVEIRKALDKADRIVEKAVDKAAAEDIKAAAKEAQEAADGDEAGSGS
jgi:hypothetical protein